MVEQIDLAVNLCNSCNNRKPDKCKAMSKFRPKARVIVAFEYVRGCKVNESSKVIKCGEYKQEKIG